MEWESWQGHAGLSTCYSFIHLPLPINLKAFNDMKCKMNTNHNQVANSSILGS